MLNEMILVAFVIYSIGLSILEVNPHFQII